MINPALYSSNKEDWGTPPELIQAIESRYGKITIDLCASEDNAVANQYITKEQNLLTLTPYLTLPKKVASPVAFMNPPYQIKKKNKQPGTGAFVERAYEISQATGITVVCLLPARTDTRWFQRWAPLAEEIVFLKGRLSFVGAPSSAPFPSCLLVFNEHPKWRRGTPEINRPDVKFWDWRTAND